MATAARMVPVASLADPFEAKLVAARLGAEGIVWEIRGTVDGVYPLGPFEVLVEEGAFETAHLLLDAPYDDDLDEAEDRRPLWLRSSLVFVVLVMVAVVLFAGVRMFSAG